MREVLAGAEQHPLQVCQGVDRVGVGQGGAIGQQDVAQAGGALASIATPAVLAVRLMRLAFEVVTAAVTQLLAAPLALMAATSLAAMVARVVSALVLMSAVFTVIVTVVVTPPGLVMATSTWSPLA